MSMKHKCAIIFSLLLCSSVNAYQSGSSKADNLGDDNDESIERVEVLGQQPVKYYLDIYRARKKDFLAEFNQLVNDGDMQVKCRVQRLSSSSRFREKRCSPIFLQRIKSEETQKAMALINNRMAIVTNINANPAVKQRVDEKLEELAVVMSALIDSNSALKEKFTRLEQAKHDLDDRKAR